MVRVRTGEGKNAMHRHARRVARATATALALLLPAGAGFASSDVTCTPSWSPVATEPTCENRAVLMPGNDTRVNLLFLLRDRLPPENPAAPLAYPAADYPGQDFGNTFFDWGRLQAGYWPAAAGDSFGDQQGTVCVSLASGDEAFAAALAANPALPAAERTALGAARARLTAACEGGAAGGGTAEGGQAGNWPDGITSAPGRAFLGYLQAAEAFYLGQFAAARDRFAGLVPAPGKERGAADRWVAEAARYMVARADLNAAMANAFDQWGDFAGPAKVDQVRVRRAREGFADYLARHPLGAYADSARGLVRRTVWLEGDTRALAQLYAAALAATPADSTAAARLVQEIDSKLLFAKDAGGALTGPELLATWDLMRMRSATGDGGEAGEGGTSVLTAAELAAQAPHFASRPELFRYLQAIHAYAVGKDPRRVLALIPDAARSGALGPVAFSGQVLRGLALAALRDPNEVGFWRQLLGGARGLWQRPTVELALAMAYERRGELAAALAPGSPITDRTTREILLMHGAGPDLLRAAAQNRARPGHERDLALFTLLYKLLSRGDYAGFLASRALVPAGADTKGGLWDFLAAEAIPVGLFTAGASSGADYACPALAVTAATLAGAPQDPRARLCLGEFWRLNGFDGFALLDQAPGRDELGGAPSRFVGTPLARGTIYAQLIAAPATPPNERAYALYRAVMCYAPSAANGCGGADVELAQRRAWFNRLKREFPQSPWARKLQYYW